MGRPKRKKNPGLPNKLVEAVRSCLRNIKLVHTYVPEHETQPPWKQPYIDSSGDFTHNFDKEDFPEGARLIAIITRDKDNYSCLSLLTKRRSTSTYQRGALFSQIRTFSPVSLQRISSKLDNKVRRFFDERRSRDLAALPKKTAEQVLLTLTRYNKAARDGLFDLAEQIDREPFVLDDHPRAWRIVADEKQALDTALRIAGLEHTRLPDGRPDQPAPILDLLQGVPILEDRQIEHDAAAFGNLRLIDADLRGRVFYDYGARTKVTVVNANRHSLESTLGVDLIIYYERFKSYLLIQYKRFIREQGKSGPANWRFRPSSDRNFRKETSQILAIRSKIINHPISNASDYRLCDDPFYFKFCKNDTFEPDKTGMAPGLHIRAVDVDHFLNSAHSKGPKSGRYLGWDNFPQRLPNTLFLELARSGWIGSRAMGSNEINRIIDISLSAKRSVIAATINQGDDEDDRLYVHDID